MKRPFAILLATAASIILLSSCNQGSEQQTWEEKKAVNRQQAQYAAGQPIPFFDWSLVREMRIKLYQVENTKVATHAVWRGNTSVIEGDCPSIGYGMPYDTSLTNPLVAYGGTNTTVAVGQAEPNGVFQSTNTAATWIFCTGEAGTLEPIYVESKVTVYPYTVKVDYANNRVTKFGESSVKIKLDGKS